MIIPIISIFVKCIVLLILILPSFLSVAILAQGLVAATVAANPHPTSSRRLVGSIRSETCQRRRKRSSHSSRTILYYTVLYYTILYYTMNTIL